MFSKGEDSSMKEDQYAAICVKFYMGLENMQVKL